MLTSNAHLHTNSNFWRLETKSLLKSGFLFALISLINLTESISQIPSCGSLSNGFIPDPGTESAIRVYDRFGNEYSHESIQVPRVQRIREGSGSCDDCNAGTIDIGIYRLYFMDIINNTNHGFDEDSPLCNTRKSVICQVFNDLKNFLVTAPGVPRVNIRIRESGVLNLSGTSNPLAAASSFYVVANGITEGIIDGECWKSINGDDDPFLNYPPAILQQSATAVPGNAGYFHGDIRFFFPENAEYYHTDLSTLPAANTIDMYTVALHEVMHMLGFASLIGSSGHSSYPSCPECYTRYDSYLEFKSNGQSVISQNPVGGDACLDISYNGPSSMATGCTNGVIFNGDNNPNQDIFSPLSWSNGSSLSHFDCGDDLLTCPFQNSQNVMTWCNQGGPAFTRRHPSQEEANTFCDLAYQRTNSWGNATNPTIFKQYTPCNNVTPICLPNPVAFNDLTYPNGQPLFISSGSTGFNFIELDVTANDFNVDGVECVSVVSGGGTVEIVPFSDQMFIRYTPPSTAFVGYIVIKYIGYKNCGNTKILSNEAFVFIKVDFPPTCPGDDCNMVCGGDFEQTAFSTAYSNFFIPPGASNSPDLYRRNPATGLISRIDLNGNFGIGTTLFAGCVQNIPNPNPYSPVSQTYIGIAASNNREGIMFQLNQSMVSTQQYRLSFWAMASHVNCLSTINIWGDDVQPCQPPDFTLLDGTPSQCGFTSNVLGSTGVLTDDWVEYIITITPSEDINYIIISVLPSVLFSYTLIDDIVLTQEPNPISLAVSSTVDNPTPCTNGQVTINYNIQLSAGQSTNPNPINLQAIIPAGFSVISPSDFSAAGMHTIPSNTLQPGTPYPLTLTLQLNGVQSGIPVQVTLDIMDNGSACYDGSSSMNTTHLTPIDALLSISTTASEHFVSTGDEVTVYVEVCNLSTHQLNGVTVTDVLPSSMSFVSSTEFTLNGSTLESQPFDLPGNIPGLPANCVLLSFKAKMEFTTLCANVENCATAHYSTCNSVSDCVQFATTNADINLANTNNLDPALQPNGESNKSISIIGTFTILGGTTYTFDACNILMQPDAEIVLEPDAKLELINGTHLYGCDDLWQSITVNQNAELIINSGSIIQDARRAIDVPATLATLRINGGIFRNNYIGIYAHYGNNAIINGMIRNSIFECLNPIFEYNNQSFAGIFLNRATIPNVRNCKFTDLNFGIYANSSPIHSSFCHFGNIQPYYPAAHSGTGIVSFTKGVVNLTVHGNFGQDPAFDNCARGVYSFNTNLQVSSLDMNKVATGVEFKIVNAPVEYPVLIGQTNIVCSDYGIKGLVLSPEQNPVMHTNNIIVSDDNQDGIASGIYVESDILQSALTINHNTIHVLDGKFGIFVRNFLNATLVLNGSGTSPNGPIQLNSSGATGIQLENTHSGFVGCNYVMDGSSMDNTTGINIVSSPMIEFNCNHVDQTAIGVRVNGVCNTPENFKGTDFGDHTTGFLIANSGRLGAQTHQGNIWDGTANMEAQNVGDPFFSRFFVDNTNPDFFPNPMDPPFDPFSPDNWFTPQFSNDSYFCNQSPCPLPAPAPVSVIDNVDLLIAGGASSKPVNFAPQGLQWMSASYLYEKLKIYPALVNQDPILTNFMNDYAQTTAGELHQLHQQTITLAEFGIDTLDYLSQVSEINSSNIQRLLEIDSLLSLSPTTPIAEILLGEQLSLLHNLRKNNWKTEHLQSSLNTLVAAKSDDIQTNNATVASANILETNYQLVNNIWLSSIGIGKPDLLYNYDSVLYQIAHQCPFEGGWGVYWARGLYSYISHQDYNDDQLCGIGQERKHAT